MRRGLAKLAINNKKKLKNNLRSSNERRKFK